MAFTWRYARSGKKNGSPSSGLSWRIASQRPLTPEVNIAPDATGRSSVCGSEPGSAAAAVVDVGPTDVVVAAPLAAARPVLVVGAPGTVVATVVVTSPAADATSTDGGPG